MSAYQRFAFDNLPPERQREILEKQQKQEIQRRLLREQIEQKERERNQPAPPRKYNIQSGAQERSHDDSPPPRTAPTFINDPLQHTVLKPGNMYMTLQRPLISEKHRLLPKNQQALSMTLNPTKIHDTFSSFRSHIMNTSNSTVMTTVSPSQMGKEKITPTFIEDE